MTTFPRAGAALVALGLLALPACAPNPGATAPNEPKPVAVTVAEAKSVALRRAVPVTGTLNPYKDVTLAPKVGGRVLRVRHDVGDRVGLVRILPPMLPGLAEAFDTTPGRNVAPCTTGSRDSGAVAARRRVRSARRAAAAS